MPDFNTNTKGRQQGIPRIVWGVAIVVILLALPFLAGWWWHSYLGTVFVDHCHRFFGSCYNFRYGEFTVPSMESFFLF